MRCVGIEIRSVAFLRRLVKIVVLRDEFLELGLDVQDLLGGEVEFH